MTISSFIIKNVLQTYDRQLDHGRRINRLNKALSQAGMKDSVTISRDARRKQLVERISKEIVDSLLVSGSNNPVVKDIKNELEMEFGHEFHFSYPPSEGEVSIVKKTEHGFIPVSGEEKEEILERLWAIALKKVDETML